MRPIGLLMIEHRLIEKIIPILEREISRISAEGKPDPALIDKAVDFFRTYANRTHHGKEEDILFRELKKKQLDAEHSEMIRELKDDHAYSRTIVKNLSEANDLWMRGDSKASDSIRESLSKLVKLYPAHIEKEDKQFFLPTEKYFSEEELNNMLQESYELDREMIHEKYQEVIESLSAT